MRISVLSLVFCSAILAPGFFGAHAEDAPPAKNLPYAEINRALTEKFTMPVYQAMVPAMGALVQASTDYCLDPPTGVYARLVDAFHAALSAWQRAQPIAFGPVIKDGRTARIEFWPDTGASTDRQIRRMLNDRDPAMVADGGLNGKSVALQSLSTFERLLAENASRLAGTDIAQLRTRDEDKYACTWMSEIARFQLRLATSIVEEWTGEFAATVSGAEAGNAAYTDARAATTDYLKSLSGILDIVIRQKLERPMDSGVAKARASRTESWRTKRSMDNIVINLESARLLFTIPGGFADLLSAAGSAALANGMHGQFDAVIATAKNLGMPLEDALGEAAMRPKLDELLRQLRAIRVLVQGPLATETDLAVGFNALDGD